MIKKIYSIAVLILIAAPAMAGGPTLPPVSVPEPGTFGLLAMSTVVLIIATRYKRKK